MSPLEGLCRKRRFGYDRFLFGCSALAALDLTPLAL